MIKDYARLDRIIRFDNNKYFIRINTADGTKRWCHQCPLYNLGLSEPECVLGETLKEELCKRGGYYQELKVCLEASQPPLESTKRGQDSTSGAPEAQTHYQGSPVEPLAIMALLMSKSKILGFLEGNATKYAMRAGRKAGEPMEKDLEKYRTYQKWANELKKFNTITTPKGTYMIGG